MQDKNLVSELSEQQLNELLTYTPGFSQENIENIKRLSLEKITTKESPPRRRIPMKKIISLVAAAILLLATSTIIFAATTGGGLDQFLSRFNPSFGEFAIAPLYPAYTENQGIRIEAVGAQQIGAVVLVYVTLQDISGENRLTRHMIPDLEIYANGQIINGPRSSKRLNFDESTNTVYYEMRIAGEARMPRTDTLELIVRGIDCLEHDGQIRTPFRGEWLITVNTSYSIQPITWTDIPAGRLHIEYMSLTPFGAQIVGTHSYGDNPGERSFPFLDVRIELENRWRNVRLPGGGGGVWHDGFSFFISSNSPIDLDAVTAVIVNGERIQIP